MFFRMDNEPAGVSRDVSTSGVYLESKQTQPEVGSTHQVAMVWGDMTVQCQARVVRKDDDGFAVEFEEHTQTFSRALLEALGEADEKE